MPMLETADGALFYDVTDLTPPWESAPETVLFHHGVGIDHGIWARWWPVLARRYRLVRFDMRGYGRSVVPAEGYAWSFDGLAADVHAVAAAAGAERFHYVGESLGGALGYYLAINHPDSLLSLIACTAPHRGGAVDWLAEWRSFVEENGMDGWSRRMMVASTCRAAISASPVVLCSSNTTWPDDSPPIIRPRSRMVSTT